MVSRRTLEVNYDNKGRLKDLIESERIRDIFPEILQCRSLDEQPYALFGTKGVTNVLDKGNITVITGPCFFATCDIKNLNNLHRMFLNKEISKNKYFKCIKDITERQPSLQNVVTVGGAINHTSEKKNVEIVSIMETYEAALLIANNDFELFNSNKRKFLYLTRKIAKKTKKMIDNFRTSHNIKSDIKYFYTHKNEAVAIYDDIFELIKTQKPRKGAWMEIDDWRNLSRTRVEIAYTTLFSKKIKNWAGRQNSDVILCENYRHFLQIIDHFNMPLELFGLNNGHNWIGLVPPPSLDNKKEMDMGVPLYLGKLKSFPISNQINLINRSSDIYILGSYLLNLLPCDKLNTKSTIKFMDTIFKSKMKYLNKEKIILEAQTMIENELENTIGMRTSRIFRNTIEQLLHNQKQLKLTDILPVRQ